MRPIIEFCASSLHEGMRELIARLEKNPDIDVVEYGCLGYCGECYLSPYALVNGEAVFAETVEKLEQAIADKINEIEAMDDLF
ncbi:YuzB family protein [Paenibacillus larvae]|uniref:UDP-N-acetylmuramoylalanine--D-glutamate ligase n=3 Tax=Paenibacillus larvae TaxID=1464 RepID=V9W6W8_9BACL|nr:YuzB family protein [Paenibacillus larvae]AHD06756.1 hypothetical protein ERIC2_c29740 [Paenibacillus larvae subsp. larvae DSM 25430]AQT84239.1 UDP-N-acetylmuramoylalanine--D-glutamate ligase [Paenibacillus larvae subsp. pulvifaciens]AQZ46215.1 UDP-N-acetylmuramoylalanine--D-glutamate ligase [Paenibacillus larvae subsp. pulvifaciens]ARF67552.1 UDP-N-acetylmuramoylalanine--D-glutamate ligase [Paenibacillus larvae subsp. pulvifaciens]AVF27887.1 hypothetical protein ERICIII_03779 [Paenibacillu